VILATTLGQEAHEWSEIEGGVFTHELLSGLSGAADVNGDRLVEYSEVQAFVASANRDIKDPRALPQVVAQPPAANRTAALVAIDAMMNMRLVTGDASKLGRFYIELDNGERYLDAHLSTTSVAIAVPSEYTAYLRAGDREATLPAHTNVALGTLRMTARTVASRGSIEAEYREALFASDYGRSYYQGYVDSVGALGVQFADLGVQRDDATQRPSKKPAVASAIVGGVAGTAAIVTGVLALKAKHDYETTNLQRPAEEARARYDRYVPIAIASGAVAVAAGALSLYLWPRGTTKLAPAATSDTVSLGLEVAW
jgi:hypothetical protein